MKKVLITLLAILLANPALVFAQQRAPVNFTEPYNPDKSPENPNPTSEVRGNVHGERVKDIAHLRGARANQLFGYGLVVGLNRTGDSQQVRFATQTVASLLARLNVRIDPQGLLLRNIATVMVTAELAPFSRNGTRLDVLVSSMGDTKNLQKNTLIATALRGHDGQVYAMAQGPLTVGGFSQVDTSGNEKIQNHPNVARIPAGGIVEREIPFEVRDKEELIWQLNEDDFTTAVRVAKEINLNFGKQIANALDSRTIQVQVPDQFKGDQVTQFISQIERIEVVPDTVAKVVINERSGTLVINQDVRIDPIAITHGNITVTIEVENKAVAATPFTPGQTTNQRNSTLNVEEEKRKMILFEPGQSLKELVDGLNQLGASSRDLITILQSLKQAGALRAKLEII